jgi:hypothetical protein
MKLTEISGKKTGISEKKFNELERNSKNKNIRNLNEFKEGYQT